MAPRPDSLRDELAQLRAEENLIDSRIPSPASFRRNVLIDANGQTVKFRPETWQEKDFLALDPAWLEIAGLGPPAKIRLSWKERPRGHSKTTDMAIDISWVLTYAQRPIRGVAVASSKEQASRLRDFIQILCRLNPYLDKNLEINNWEVRNKVTGSNLSIMSSDVASAWGELVDFIVCDEVSHWPEGRGEELWGAAFSTVGKRLRCILSVITNAGFTESWVWPFRESIKNDPAWHFSRLEGPQASWITEEMLRQQRKLPAAVYDRVWNNVWTVGTGDALPEAQILAALVRDGPLVGPEDGWQYFGGVDLGVKRDHAGLSVVGKSRSGVVRLARRMRWKPPGGGKIDLGSVRAAVCKLDGIFHATWYFDPYQGELMVQDLIKVGVMAEVVVFGGQALMEMAGALVELFHSGAIELFPSALGLATLDDFFLKYSSEDTQLVSDLKKLRIAEASSGWRLDAPRTSEGHADEGIALTLACLGARRAPTWMDGEYLTGEKESAFYKMPSGVYPEEETLTEWS